VPGDFHEQRIFVKCCVKLGKSFTETFEVLKTAFGNEALGRTQTYEWWKRFKDNRTSTDVDLVQADRQYPKLIKLLQKLGKTFVLTVV
jgi:hypothetical protein